MSLFKDENEYISEIPIEEDEKTLTKKRQIRKRLEARLEAKRIKEDLDDFDDDEFDWSEFNK